MDIFTSLIGLVFRISDDTSRALPTYGDVYEEVMSQLERTATMAVERIWSDEDRYEAACRHMAEPTAAELFNNLNTPGLCWTVEMFDRVVVPALVAAGTPQSSVDILTQEMRGYIHYNVMAATFVIQEVAMVIGHIPSAEMVRRYVRFLVSHERRHMTQSVEEVVITSMDPNGSDYQCQPHEADANFAALCELRSIID